MRGAGERRVSEPSESMQERMTQGLVLDALKMALGRRRPDAGMLHHSDRGSQYASAAFQSLLREEQISCSMSRRGNCWDNAMMESFFATLKKEGVRQERYATRAQAAKASLTTSNDSTTECVTTRRWGA